MQRLLFSGFDMNAATKTFAFSTLLCCLIVLCECAKYEKEGYMPRPGLALTFDDYSITDWHNCLTLFDSFNVRATFYVSNYDKLTAKDKQMLHQLQEHGHEIGYHSLTHPNFVKYIQKHPIAQLLAEEIDKGISLMNADGFYPQTFAYPYGCHNNITDQALLRKFKSLRALNGSPNRAKSFTATSDNELLYSIGMDESSGKSMNELLDLIHLAQKNNNCLVLVGHRINQPSTKLQVPYEKLKKIITTTQALGMKFYTVSEISRL